jgi:nucleolar complex protein 2
MEDSASFASVEELDGAHLGRNLLSIFFAQALNYIDEGATHMLELSELAEKDPEFYRYLQEHDRELLEFNLDDDDDVDDADDDADDKDTGQLPVLTENILRTWQNSLLKVGTLGGLRNVASR